MPEVIYSLESLDNKRKSRTSHGYVILLMPDHPHAMGSRYVYEHRAVMEAVLCRHLRTDEIVHHKNGDKMDNRPENLALTDGIASHKLQHRRPGKGMRLPGEPNPVIQCKCGCGKTFLKYDDLARPRRFAQGCSWRKGKRNHNVDEMTFCACGCGRELLKYDRQGRIRRYIPGHNARRLSKATKEAIKREHKPWSRTASVPMLAKIYGISEGHAYRIVGGRS